MKGNFHVRFCRRVRMATSVLSQRWVRFVSSKNGESKFKVYEEQEFNLSYRLNTTLDNLMTMRVQVPLHRRNG
ncbi:hypothetical protein MiSe_87800 [Microseira wollei NIES-4236]|uniref:Transposase n=1 Tax=Microseira wollei NIES-4236 TaxID=2530354 RepID=A0AAV3XN56_9CYAN|nr:hypothetical protein MiSe_87800 [Microseira wollei NIES-4236]